MKQLNALLCLSKTCFENNPNLSSSEDLLANMYVTSSVVTPELDIALSKANLGGTVSSTSEENTRNIVSNCPKNITDNAMYLLYCRRRGGLGSSPDQVHCVMTLGKTFCIKRGLDLHPGAYMDTGKFNARVN